ncbi:hypothetical protein PHLGIDRAFT_99474 [Phlebiopsis gigantea 11061_1 CR5-6]|uniref:BTB domain-containing protein n=1 Tax=Phlebiopsis gigantea (strain 11061_1 CR5-6) TaxID=745531 RepID=A0A0C3SDA5_PHLG1|nr:hypothetical protein PHLGIDRAFT_99474 [Phlebiopsis gigantea 11061_1 CR5-6]
MSNPSHILIARTSRGLSGPSATLSSPTETHAAAAGIFRSAGSPPWSSEAGDTDDSVSEMGSDEFEDQIDIDPTFTKIAKLPGNVKIVVENTTFWTHKEVLFFASPFFEAALSGDWAETGRPQSMSSVITISQPPTIPRTGSTLPPPTSEATLVQVESDTDNEEFESDARASDSEAELSELNEEDKEKARMESLSKLESPATTTLNAPLVKGKQLATAYESKPAPTLRRRTRHKGPDATIVLKEEKASTFHDFLKYVYPHLVCTITWNNVEGLMNISHKLTVPALQRECLDFLLTHAAGRPIKAMRIAELFEEEELYRESSRFVLDNPGGWTEQELSTLSSETLLKLEKRRTWFLERVLKLGLTQVAKEYQCCSTCPDPPTCARLLEEKWRQAYQAVFRFGPCQPSIVFRYLRTLEAVSPPLSLTHLSCQTTAKAFTATLFDRMFSLGLRGSGTDAPPLGARVVAAVAGATIGPRRHFLYCPLKSESQAKPKRSEEGRTAR